MWRELARDKVGKQQRQEREWSRIRKEGRETRALLRLSAAICVRLRLVAVGREVLPV